MHGNGHQGPSEQQLEARRQQRREDQDRGAAMTQATAAQQLGQIHNPQFIEIFGDPDIGIEDDEDDDLDAKVSTELSRLLMFSNIDEEEYEGHTLINQNIAERIKRSEYVPPRGPGSKCSGEYRAMVTGDPSEADKPHLEAEIARRIDGAVGEESVRSAMQALAIGGKAFDGLTQMQTAVFSDGGGGNFGSSKKRRGILGGAKSLLFGD